MNTLITDMMEFIESGTDWVNGTNLFGGREPTSPDNTLTLFDAPGRPRFLGLNRDEQNKGSDAYEYLGMQARIRSHDYEEAMTQASALVDFLHGTGNMQFNGTLYTVIEALDNPFLLEWDESNRAKIVTNFLVQRTPYNQ